MPAFDVDALRAEFPALARTQDGRPVAFLDGPGGTQVPQRVIDAVVGYFDDAADHVGYSLKPGSRSSPMGDIVTRRALAVCRDPALLDV